MADPLVVGSPTGSPPNSTSPTPALADLQTQIQNVHQAEQSVQKQISQALHLGTATPANVAAAANAIRQIQAQRQALEGQVRQLTTQQNPTFSATAAPASFASASAPGLSASPTPSAALTPVLAARQSLMQQIAALKQQGPVDGQTLANLLADWQMANAAVLTQARQSEAAASAANRPKILARLLAGGGQASAPADLLPKAQALLAAQQAATQDLAIVVLQSGGQTPAAYQAALGQWRATHAPTLSRLNTAAEVETKAIGVAAAQAATSITAPAGGQ
jgi:hypothetical protein